MHTCSYLPNTTQTHTYQAFTRHTLTLTHYTLYARLYALSSYYLVKTFQYTGCVILTHTNAYVNTYRILACLCTRMHSLGRSTPNATKPRHTRDERCYTHYHVALIIRAYCITHVYTTIYIPYMTYTYTYTISIHTYHILAIHTVASIHTTYNQ